MTRLPRRNSPLTRLRRDGRMEHPPSALGWRTPLVRSDAAPLANVLYFGRGEALPRLEDHLHLQAHARMLRRKRALHVTVVGHANRSESRAATRQLALRRAQNVRALLLLYGARPRQVEAQGLAAALPAADPSTPRGRALNRRVRLCWPEPDIRRQTTAKGGPHEPDRAIRPQIRAAA